MERSDRRQPAAADVRSFVTELYGHDLHAKRVESLAGATLGVMQSALAGGGDDRAGAGAGPGLGHQARDQAGGPDAEQPRHRRVGQLRPLGAASDRRAPGHPGGDGLDRVRPRRSGDARAAPGHRPWPRGATAVAECLEGRAEESAQRFRGRVPAAAGRARAARRAASPSWPIAASAIRSCSRISPNWASAT